MSNRPLLAINDNPRLCQLVTFTPENAAPEVLSAFDGPTGIETARVAQPAVILLDMMMPGVDGIDTCHQLKQDPVLQDIPVVGITASPDLTYTAKAFRAGAELFLPKPFGLDNLLRVVTLASEAAERQIRVVPRHQRHPRFTVEIPVQCLINKKPHPIRGVVGHTSNVSLNGLLVFFPEKLAPGTVFQIRLGLPDGVIPVEAAVVWQNPQPVAHGRLRHGIKLLCFPEDDDLILYRRFLSQIAIGHPSNAKS
ncbi:MAG: response regulator [Candidatus Methylomirabilales bacterium]